MAEEREEEWSGGEGGEGRGVQFFDTVLFHLGACFYLFCAGQTKADPER